jgi:hypothetical protein
MLPVVQQDSSDSFHRTEDAIVGHHALELLAGGLAAPVKASPRRSATGTLDGDHQRGSAICAATSALIDQPATHDENESTTAPT